MQAQILNIALYTKDFKHCKKKINKKKAQTDKKSVCAGARVPCADYFITRTLGS